MSAILQHVVGGLYSSGLSKQQSQGSSSTVAEAEPRGTEAAGWTAAPAASAWIWAAFPGLLLTVLPTDTILLAHSAAPSHPH